jgi:hypothetical protein
LAIVLLGWELGEGLGHVQRLVRVGRALAAEGHRPVFALANVAEPWPLFQQEPWPFLQAPYWNFRPWRGSQPFMASSLADVLAVRGWEKPATLEPLVQAWKNLADMVQPRLIVCDYSPTLCLAVWQEIPVIQVGSWFGMPPANGDQFPALVPGHPPVLPQDKLLHVVREVQGRRQKPIPPTLTAILRGERFPTFFPELDPYQAERAESVWDPMDMFSEPVGPAPASGFFAYLTADNASVEPFLTHMAMTGIPGTVYLRSASGELKERLRLLGLNVLDNPAPLGDMLARSAVVVHHGGSMANAVAFAGRPQVLIPQHLEQTITARLLARLGVAVLLAPNTAPEAAGRSLKQIQSDRRYVDQATALAQKVRERPPRPALPDILACCRRYLENG